MAEEYQNSTPLEYEEIKSGIDRIVANLPEKRQQVFVLSRTEGLSNKEIAQQLNISEKTVEDHITHAIKQIKSSMKEMGIISLLWCLPKNDLYRKRGYLKSRDALFKFFSYFSRIN